MNYQYSRPVSAPTDTLWAALVEPAAMQPHLPGNATVTGSGENALRVSMKLSMGFLRPTVNVDVQLSNVSPERSLSFEFGGKSMGAGVEGSGQLTLQHISDGSTQLELSGDVQTSGLLNKVSDSKIRVAADGFLDDYFGSIEQTAK